MSRLLLIEPQTILREAIRRFLSQDHELHATERWKLEDLKNFDLVIADEDALQKTGESVSRLSEALVAAAVPTLWLVGKAPAEAGQETRRTLQKPLEREPLRTALRDLLAGHAEAEASSGPQPVIIELTEVVEADPPKEAHEKNKE